jgi:hypothetical protein
VFGSGSHLLIDTRVKICPCRFKTFKTAQIKGAPKLGVTLGAQSSSFYCVCVATTLLAVGKVSNEYIYVVSNECLVPCVQFCAGTDHVLARDAVRVADGGRQICDDHVGVHGRAWIEWVCITNTLNPDRDKDTFRN